MNISNDSEHPGEWLTKEAAADYLLLRVRRVEQLVHDYRWQTYKKRIPGRRLPATMIRVEDLKAYKASRSAITIDVGEPGQPHTAAKREPSPPVWVQTFVRAFSDLAEKIGRLLDMQAQLIQMQAQLIQRFDRRDGIAQPHQHLNLAKAARHIGLTRPFLEEACERGALPYVWDGPPAKQKRMVRVADVEMLNARALQDIWAQSAQEQTSGQEGSR